ncbi:MAG TPA: TrmH family RNA methyltransferase [Candidatus Xenobia bacterium]
MEEPVRCPYRTCGQVHAAEVWATVVCPACGRAARGRPVRLEASLEARRRQAGDRPLPAIRSALILEDIRSMWNVGSMLRTADGLGVSHVFLCGITGIPPHPELERTALGAEQVVSWSYCRHPFDAMEVLGDVPMVSLESGPGAVPLTAWSGERFALVVGNEPGGVSAEVLAESRATLYIRMQGHKESLNVAVAAGIALWTLLNGGTRQP